MNRKVITLAGLLVLSGATATLCAPMLNVAQTSVNSQKEFDKTFKLKTDAKALNLAGHAFDNQNSRLFWFTDLEAAKKQAKAEGKPILSLRLLGNLSDEFSCANSRFFRVLLYPNAQINPILRDKFVLHWSSERPVPVITIDFGNGRKMKQTLTGNSAHYLLDDSGRPLDVLPGLYSPRAFELWLTEGEKLAATWKTTPVSERDDMLQKWHRARIETIWGEQGTLGKDPTWVQAQTEISLRVNPLIVADDAPNLVIPAWSAAPLAVSKRAIEAPFLDAAKLFSTSARVAGWGWGARSSSNVNLDEETKARIKAMKPRLNESAVVSEEVGIEGAFGLFGTGFPEFISEETPLQKQKADPFDLLILNLERNVSIDTIANKYRMEIPIHALFVTGKEGDFQTLNRKIYDKLFLTPKRDPFLGLGSDGVFTGLQNSGIVQTSPTQ